MWLPPSLKSSCASLRQMNLARPVQSAAGNRLAICVCMSGNAFFQLAIDKVPKNAPCASVLNVALSHVVEGNLDTYTALSEILTWFCL